MTKDVGGFRKVAANTLGVAAWGGESVAGAVAWVPGLAQAVGVPSQLAATFTRATGDLVGGEGLQAAKHSLARGGVDAAAIGTGIQPILNVGNLGAKLTTGRTVTEHVADKFVGNPAKAAAAPIPITHVMHGDPTKPLETPAVVSLKSKGNTPTA